MLPRCLRRAAAQTPEAPLLLHKFVRQPGCCPSAVDSACCSPAPLQPAGRPYPGGGRRPARRRHGPSWRISRRTGARGLPACVRRSPSRRPGRTCRGCGAVPASRTGSCCHALRHTHPSRCLSRSTEVASDLRGSILPARQRLRRDSVTCGARGKPYARAQAPAAAERAGRFDGARRPRRRTPGPGRGTLRGRPIEAGWPARARAAQRTRAARE
jgi:hypothetical protein